MIFKVWSRHSKIRKFMVSWEGRRCLNLWVARLIGCYWWTSLVPFKRFLHGLLWKMDLHGTSLTRLDISSHNEVYEQATCNVERSCQQGSWYNLHSLETIGKGAKTLTSLFGHISQLHLEVCGQEVLYSVTKKKILLYTLDKIVSLIMPFVTIFGSGSIGGNYPTVNQPISGVENVLKTYSGVRVQTSSANPCEDDDLMLTIKRFTNPRTLGNHVNIYLNSLCQASSQEQKSATLADLLNVEEELALTPRQGTVATMAKELDMVGKLSKRRFVA